MTRNITLSNSYANNCNGQVYASKESYPAAEHHEPYLPVENGVVKFEYISVYELT
ncbi:MAG: hypothetical protein U9O89_03755 [Thermoproteota archaeon]|nr:hypothetical protein [Thermoproteota archaeon]